jgi:DNA-binding IclR family transcriptional regulator
MRTLKNAVPAGAGGDDEGARDRHRIVALSRGLEILRAFAEASGPLSNQDLVGCTGLPKSTVSRLTRTLTIEGFLLQLPRTAQYQLAPAIVSLARAYHHSTGLAEVARPHMQELADEIHGTVAVAARDRLEMVYLAIARRVSRIQVPQDPGSRVPIGTTATGLAYLNTLPAAERDALAAALVRQNARNAPMLEQEIERTRMELARNGFCVCAGTWRRDVNGVGVPIVLPDQTVVAFNVGGPPFWLKEEKLYQDVGPRLLAMARNVLADFSRRGGAAH